jgi:hypothetical protein
MAIKLIEYFRAFLEDIVNLNQSRLDDLDERVPRITAALEADKNIGSDILDSIPQGSWAHRTIIRPKPAHEFDADFLIQIAERREWKDDPRKYANAIWDALCDSSIYKDKVARKDRCVRVTYANDCHVDVVPYVVLDDREVIINRVTNEFEDTNPVAFTEWLQGKDDVTESDLRRVIRLLKYLRDHRGSFTIKSVLLTALVGGVVEDWKATLDADYYKDVPTTLLHVVEDLDTWLQARPTKPSITDPGCPSTTFDHRWTQTQYQAFRTRIHELAPQIRTAYDTAGVNDSLQAWQDVFGDSFKTPAVKASAEPVLAKTAAAAVIARGPRAPHERFIDDMFPVNLTHTVTVECEVAQPVNRAQRRMRLRSRGHHVGRGRWLLFKLVHTDVKAPYDVYWKVRNRGPQASGRERGKIFRDTGQRQQRESTLFRGPHYVECYIVKDKVCVAAAHVAVNIDG